jgi:hypothetical protein
MAHVHQDQKGVELIHGAHQIAASGTDLQVPIDLTGIIGNTILENSGFHTPKNFSENNPEIRAWNRKIILSDEVRRRMGKG